MAPIRLLVEATEDGFDEAAYLRANPDVARAVADGTCPSGRAHFDAFGKTERRCTRLSVPDEWKREKLDRIAPRGELHEERRAARVMAECGLEAGAAPGVLERFERAYPGSAYLGRVRENCAAGATDSAPAGDLRSVQGGSR